MNSMTIGRVAKLADVGVETIRFYEREGLIEEPPRRASGYRQYPTDTVDRLRFIRRAKELGFTLKEIKELMSLRDGGGRRRGEVRALAEAKMRDIDQKLARLQAMRSALDGLVESCVCGRRPTCPILEALNDPEDEAATRRRTPNGKQ
ncbi:MAG: MerR family DNA-binding protein [Candidatus Latescibacteria bacterium]|nr:MerR family DNA-binding protein [Candidatus Latescibacterota bacterium]